VHRVPAPAPATPAVEPTPPAPATPAVEPTPPAPATPALQPTPAAPRRIRAALAITVAFAAAAALALALALVLSTTGGASKAVSATVNTDANVRSAPSTSAQVAGSLSAGQRITLSCATKAGAATWDRLAKPQKDRYVASWLVSAAGRLPAC
jgi:hypothetical protein